MRTHVTSHFVNQLISVCLYFH